MTRETLHEELSSSWLLALEKTRRCVCSKPNPRRLQGLRAFEEAKAPSMASAEQPLKK
ncbi:hypothetical protein JHK86_024808 [Glycine max]|nr:hypothetical protein JHK86_024808 [Glycine max]